MQYVVFFAGAFLTFFAFFANLLNLDHASRYGMLLLGIILIAWSTWMGLQKKGLIPAGVNRWFKNNHQQVGRFLFSAPMALIAGIPVLVFLAVYSIWFSSTGYFPNFPKVDNTYLDLSEAFLHGQVSLSSQPDPRLAELENPYDSTQWKDIPVIWDLSYYKGHYYVYWGPVPGLEFLAMRGLGIQNPPAQSVTLFSYIGITLVLFSLLWFLWRRYFPSSPGWLAAFFTLAGCLNLPYLFLLGRPQVYETSIISGQLFLLLGILFGLFSTNTDHPLPLLLAGLSWSLAVGSRYNLALSVGFYLVFYGLFLYQKQDLKHVFWKKMGLLLAPLVLVGTGLAVYNFVRFDNPFETGLGYQLTVPVFENRYSSSLYILSNLYFYLFYPLSTSNFFPFIKFNLLNQASFSGWAAISSGKLFDEVGAGIIYCAPLFLLGVSGVPFLLSRGMEKLGWKKPAVTNQADAECKVPLGWIAAMLAAAALAQFGFLMVFYYGAMRFMADFYLPLLVLVFICVLKVDGQLKANPVFRVLFWLVVILLCAATAGIGYFAGFDIPPQVFRQYNPEIYNSLSESFNARFFALQGMINNPGPAGTAIRYILHLLGWSSF
jgi:hypothetical protein